MLIRIVFLAVACACAGAHAAPITYFAELTGPNEAPPNASPGIGQAYVTIDTAAHTLVIDVAFSGLIGTVTAAHIHCCTATPFTDTVGVATMLPTFAGFRSGVTAGTYLNTFDTSLTTTFGAAFLTANGGTAAGAEAALAAGLAQGRAYFNIHTTQFSGGEIRGFLTPIPEPGTMALVGIPVALAWILRWGRRTGRA
ncbi:MAG: CHRD domain-containing protein [Bryobacteraceae bacterium]